MNDSILGSDMQKEDGRSQENTMTTNLTNNLTPLARKGNNSIVTAMHSTNLEKKGSMPMDDSFLSPKTTRHDDQIIRDDDDQ